MDKAFVYRIASAGSDGEIREVMKKYIRKHFYKLLGDDVKLLETSGGLEALSAKYGLPAMRKPAAMTPPANFGFRRAA